MAREEVIVQRSGDSLYLVGNKREGIAVDLEEGSTSDVLSTQSFLAHCHVNDPWEVLTDHEQLPELARGAIETFRRHADKAR